MTAFGASAAPTERLISGEDAAVGVCVIKPQSGSIAPALPKFHNSARAEKPNEQRQLFSLRARCITNEHRTKTRVDRGPRCCEIKRRYRDAVALDLKYFIQSHPNLRIKQ